MPTQLDPEQILGLTSSISDLETADSQLDSRITLEDSINDAVDASLAARISLEDSINDKVDVSLATSLSEKQNTLISGTNIKTINGNSVLGSGNISISGVANPITLSSKVGSNLIGNTNQISAFVLIPAGTIKTNNSIYRYTQI
jgi:hypothetical protein